MKKYLRYILDTFLCRFSRHFVLKDATLKWLTYNLGKPDYGNQVEVNGSAISHCHFGIDGEANQIKISRRARMAYCNIKISGSNNTVIFDGCSGIVALTLRGNNCKVTIGRDTTIEQAYMVCMGDDNAITIGEDCMFSGDVEIWNTDSHLITDLQGTPLNNKPTPIIIGNHVWIGKHTRLLKGVTIGNNAIVGMESVITKDVPSHTVAAGNPAKVVKQGVNWEKGFITEHSKI